MNRRSALALFAAWSAATLSTSPWSPALAADYPSAPVTVIIPYTPGGATDIVGRVLCDQLSRKFGQNFLIVNKPGAFGILAMQDLVRAKPDGYTLLVSNVTVNGITPVLFPKRMTFDYESSIKPITQLASLPGVLLATTVNFPVQTMPELIAYAKQNPGKVRYGSTGIGSYPQFDTELMARRAGVSFVHVPIKGGASDMINSLAVGDIQIGFLNVASAEGMVKAGRMRALAVVAPTQLAQYPGVPTMEEVGFGGIGTQQWQAIYARAGTPQPIIDLLFKSIKEIMQSEQTKQAFRSNGISVLTSDSPADALAWEQAEQKKWRTTIEETKIVVE